MEGSLVGRSRKYDWDKWLNGKQWMLVQWVDFEMAPEKFRPQITTAAGNRRLKAITRITKDDDGNPAILVQAIPKPGFPPPAPEKPPERRLLHLAPPQAATAEGSEDLAADAGH